MNDFEGLVVVVTGGASGIGAAAAQEMTGRGATVAVLDRADDAQYRCDVADDASVVAAVDQLIADHGRIDVLINNAGIGAQGRVDENSDDEWLHVLDVNVVGIARVSRRCLPYLRNSPSAAIVNTCSVVAEVGLPNRALYSASKGAVRALTLAMAADHLADGIRVNCVVPGTANTPWVGRLLEAAADPTAERAALSARQPMGRLVESDEVAKAIAYLASPTSGSTTGVCLPVDGGLLALRVPPRSS
jgi:NAD(P)-dependent dehydrogenase (short-subunit alcohol dehydrogenase family)